MEKIKSNSAGFEEAAYEAMKAGLKADGWEDIPEFEVWSSLTTKKDTDSVLKKS